MMRRSKRPAGGKTSKPAEKVAALFEQYKDDDADEIGPEGVERLCGDIGIDPSDRKILLLAWKMGAERMGYFSREEFQRGLGALDAADLEALPPALAALEAATDGSDSQYRDFFQFAFKFLLTEPRQRIIDVDTAVQMLGIAGRPSEPHLRPFMEFLGAQTEYKAVNLDQWMGFLRFCAEVDAECSNFDAMEAWPLLLDNYVEWRRGGGGGGGS